MKEGQAEFPWTVIVDDVIIARFATEEEVREALLTDDYGDDAEMAYVNEPPNAGESTTPIGEWWVDAMTSVRVTVTDPEHIERCFTDEWQSHYCTFRDVEEVLQHLAFNCIVNGRGDASRLDGWADLEPGQLTMHQDRLVEWERVVEPEPERDSARNQPQAHCDPPEG